MFFFLAFFFYGALHRSGNQIRLFRLLFSVNTLYITQKNLKYLNIFSFLSSVPKKFMQELIRQYAFCFLPSILIYVIMCLESSGEILT